MYLLEETPEAENLRQKVIDLLLSNEINNIDLALQIIEGGGMHKDFVAPIHVLYLRRITTSKAENLIELTRPFFSEQQIKQIQDAGIFILPDAYNAIEWEQYFEHMMLISEEYSLGDYVFQIASSLFQSTGLAIGRKICFFHDLFPHQYIFSHAIPSDLLDLKDFQLEDLPVELATAKAQKIDLRGNSFSKMQKCDWVNTFVEIVDLDLNVKKKVMKQIVKCFPNAIAKSYHDLASSAWRNGNSKQAVAFLRAIPLKYRHLGHYGNRARYALDAGYAHTVLVFQEYEEKKYGIIYNLVRASAYAILQNKTKTINFLAKGIIDIYSFTDEDIEKMKTEHDVRFEGYNDQVRKNRFFDGYKEDEDVQGLINARINMNDAHFLAYLQEILGKFPICTQIFPENRFRSFAKYFKL
jgi:hypothetical protein